ncbi:hypothetical protein GW17_00046950 [Ensete ventricosum]|nr:hypothetical protein GW17_00046950 [Ensete ventricosum]
MRVSDKVVGDIRPDLDSLACGLNLLQDFVLFNIASHGHFILLSVDVHRLNSYIEAVRCCGLGEEECQAISTAEEEDFTCHGGDGIPDFEFTPLAVHPDLELHRLQLLPLCVLVAATQEAADVISHDAYLRPANNEEGRKKERGDEDRI